MLACFRNSSEWSGHGMMVLLGAEEGGGFQAWAMVPLPNQHAFMIICTEAERRVLSAL